MTGPSPETIRRAKLALDGDREPVERGRTAGSLRAAIGNAKRHQPKSQAILVSTRDAEVLASDRVHGLQVIAEPRLKPGQFALLMQRPRQDEEVQLT